MRDNEPTAYQVDFNPLTEFAVVVKSICDQYEIAQEDLCKFGYIPALFNLHTADRTRRVRQVPIRVPIGGIYAPITEVTRTGRSEPTHIDMTYMPTPTSHNPRQNGMYEYKVKLNDKWIRYWCYAIMNESALFDHTMILVEKKNLRDFYRVCLELDQYVVEVDPPILAKGMLDDIWTNTIGFLEDAEINKDKYKEFHIPCKRGLLLAGRPGCVLGDTEISIRKKSKEGTHKIYDV